MLFLQMSWQGLLAMVAGVCCVVIMILGTICGRKSLGELRLIDETAAKRLRYASISSKLIWIGILLGLVACVFAAWAIFLLE